jgi:predicted MPP superfamily phosphohydrolase
VGIFLLCVLAVYLVAIFLAVRRFLLRRQMRSRLSKVEWIFYLAAFLGCLCALYSLYVEPYWPQVTHVALTNSKVAAPLRIVLISDLHSDGKIRLENRLPDLIRQQHPDLIAFAGDTVNSRAGVPVAHEVMTQLAAIAPTYVVLGNWDVELDREWGQSFSQSPFFAGTGVHNLLGSGEMLELKGNQIWITGAATDQEYLLSSLLQKTPPGRFSIFLFHFPDCVVDVNNSPIDLYLAGHTHGGQVALPFYGALITFSRYDKKYESGLFHLDHAWMYVNRGLGMEGHSPRARFFARPEITVIDVAPTPRK